MNERPFDLTKKTHFLRIPLRVNESVPHANILTQFYASFLSGSLNIDQNVVRKIFVICVHLLGESIIYLKYYDTNILKFPDC